MNSVIETFNSWAGHALTFLWPMLWQSSLLIVLLFGLDWAARRKARAAVRYAFWLVLLLKLVLPPSLAFPTGIAWWLRPSRAEPAPPHQNAFVVDYGPSPTPAVALKSLAIPTPTTPKKPTLEASFCFAWGIGALALLACMLARWRSIARIAQQATPAPDWVNKLRSPWVDHASRTCRAVLSAEGSAKAEAQRRRVTHHVSRSPVRRSLGEGGTPVIKVTNERLSPAVCGLLRPVILLPRALLDHLPHAQLRAVLLDEQMHLRRRDVWVNCAQALLQAAYWWHPLLWLANGRIRRLREEAVDDAVMLALRDEAECYAPTLLEVAKVALQRPLASLCLVGILEPRSSLQRRIERLLEFRPPKKSGMTLASTIGLLSLSALALPMGPAPAGSSASAGGVPTPEEPIPVVATNRVAIRTLVQDGKLLFELGKWDDAEAKLKQAVKLDPSNQAAYYYLNLVHERRDNESLNQRDSLPQPNPSLRTNVIWTGRGRQIIESKLHRIRLDTLGSSGLPLSEVLRDLNNEAKQRDPEKRGINFIYNGNLDAATGLPIPAAADIGAISINIDPPITNVTLADALDAIVKVAEQPIKYSIQDYAVVFSAKGKDEPPPFYTRNFKVDPKTFTQKLRAIVGTNTPAGTQRPFPSDVFKTFMYSLGIDWEHPPGKKFFYTVGEGCLMVRSTLADVDTVQQAVDALDSPPNPRPQINIKAKIVEVRTDENRADGFNSYLTSLLKTNGLSKVGAPSSVSLPRTNRVASLSDMEFRKVLAALKESEEARVLWECSITTLSDREATIQWQEDSAKNSLSLAYSKAYAPRLDFVPHIRWDGSKYLIYMTVTPAFPEFLGYTNAFDSDGLKPQLPGILSPNGVTPPHFRVCQFPSAGEVADGETMVVGGIPSEDETVAGIASLSTIQPLKIDSQNRKLIIFITPTAIDAAGNRIDPDN
jgi:beta-lactamase regulating signal transducer with metallopeptidase domain